MYELLHDDSLGLKLTTLVQLTNKKNLKDKRPKFSGW